MGQNSSATVESFAELFTWLQTNFPTADVVRTAVLLLLVLGTRWLVLKRLRDAEGLSYELRKRWASQVRIASMLLILLGLLLIWGTALRTFALALVAIAVAIVIATKELIMCLSGTLLKASGRAYQIGDRIEIGAHRGDVVDQTLLTTSLLEVGPGNSFHQHTGRLIVIPNSTLLTAPVVNESFTEDYVLHAFSVSLKEDDDWQEAERALLKAAREECSSYMREAQKHMTETARKEGLEAMSVEPRITLRLDGEGASRGITLLVRVATPARRKGRVEQAVLRRYLSIRDQLREQAETSTD